MKRFVASLVLFVLATSGVISQSKEINYEELNDKIFGHLEFLNEKGKNGRLLNGGLMIGLGILSGVGGYFVYTSPTSDSELSQMLGYQYQSR
jgi:hypothetical protein